MPFAHLHVHTMYSILDGVSSPEELIKVAKAKGMPSIAITDHGTMSGIVQFYDTCRAMDIHPVLGCELYVTGDRLIKDKEKKADVSHLTVLAKTNEGLSNLLKIASLAELEGFYYKPRADLSLIADNREGLILLSGCLKGELASYVYAGDKEKAITCLERHKDLFGDNFYIEIQPNGLEEQVLYNKRVAGLAKKAGISLVATNDVHYANPDDWLLQDAMLAIQFGKTLDDDKRMKFSWQEFYLADEEEMAEMFRQNHPDLKEAVWQEAMDNAVQLSESCKVDLEKNRGELPKVNIATEEEMDEQELLIELCYRGWHERGFKEIPQDYIDRLAYEIDIICEHGFTDYFLVIYDVVQFAKANGIAYGPGRGSAAGSLVAYALGITHIDPMRHDLMFERFINPDRNELPDIDMDFERDKRQEIKDYLSEKYGKDNVASIRVNSAFRMKNAFRDTCRIMGVEAKEVNRLSKLFADYSEDDHIENYINQEAFQKALSEVDDVNIEKIASGLVGKVRQRGQHAAGLIVSRDSLFGNVPLEIVNNQVTSAWDKYVLPRMGYLKLDILGSRTIQILEQTRQLVENRTGEVIDWNKVPLDDEATIKEFAEGNTVGVFQFQGEGITNLCRDMKPETFEDIVAINALFRPGPLRSGYTKKYVQRKRGRDKIPSMHESMEKITHNTYGLMIYQEQAMQMVHDIAGFTMSEADGVRKAMSSKVGMEKYESKFLEGASKSIGESNAEKFWFALQQFGSYMFNKAHSTAYSYVAYYTMWAKVHYPIEFLCASLSSAPDEDKIKSYIMECKRLGVKVLRPDINASQADFSIDGENIRAGLSLVKGVGDRTIEAILKGRGKGFKSFRGFVEKVHGQFAKKNTIKALIDGGAFLRMYPNQDVMAEQYEAVLDIIKGQKQQQKKHKGQKSLFDPEQMSQMPDMISIRISDLEEGWKKKEE